MIRDEETGKKTSYAFHTLPSGEPFALNTTNLCDLGLVIQRRVDRGRTSADHSYGMAWCRSNQPQMRRLHRIRTRHQHPRHVRRVGRVGGSRSVFSAFNSTPFTIYTYSPAHQSARTQVLTNMPCCVSVLSSIFSATGLDCTGRLFVSDRAHLVMGFHQIVDGLKEIELGGSR